MAKAHKKNKTKTKIKTKKNTSQVSTATSPQPAAVVVATRTLSLLAPLTEDARAAFLGQTTAAERQALGGRTRATDVLTCAGEWIPIIQRSLDRSKATIRYAASRLAFLCDSTLALADAIDHARAGLKTSSTAAARIGATRTTARHLRGELIHALGEVTRGSEEEAAELATIERKDQDVDLVGALGDLAKLAQTYLDRAKKDSKIAAIVDGVLAADDVAAATATAKALSAAGVGKSDAGSARPIDPPEVNLAEGTVMGELRVAHRAFEKGHAIDASIPRLIPPQALRSIFGSHRAPPPAATKPAPAASTPAQ